MSTDGPTIRPDDVHFFAKFGLRPGDDGGAGARLCAIARTLEAPISFFFSELWPKHRAQAAATRLPFLPPQERQLLSAYARIENLPLRRAVLAVAE
jgi:hypothetical protein